MLGTGSAISVVVNTHNFEGMRLPLGRELEAEQFRSRPPCRRELCRQVARNDFFLLDLIC